MVRRCLSLLLIYASLLNILIWYHIGQDAEGFFFHDWHQQGNDSLEVVGRSRSRSC